MADLHTFVPVRRHPAGPVETFAQVDAYQELVEERMTSDDGAGALLRFEDGARGTVSISQVSAGRKNSIAIEIDGPRRRWRGPSRTQSACGSAIGRSNELLNRDPSLVAPEARRIIGYPGGHAEGYPDTFRALFSQVYADIARGGLSPEPHIRRSAISTWTRSRSPRRSRRAWPAVLRVAVERQPVPPSPGGSR